MLRIFRIFKMQRFLDEARFLMNSLKRSGVKILIFMMFVFIIAVILGATMYGIEGDRNEAISSIPRGVYWAVVTITTVGYGDIAPVTATGQFISTIVMLLGYSIIAVPTGIVAGETIEEHRRRHTHRKPSNHSRLEQHETIEEEDPDSPEQTAEKTIILREEDPAARVNEEDLL
jgi:voltage-gated potassium channel